MTSKTKTETAWVVETSRLSGGETDTVLPTASLQAMYKLNFSVQFVSVKSSKSKVNCILACKWSPYTCQNRLTYATSPSDEAHIVSTVPLHFKGSSHRSVYIYPDAVPPIHAVS